MPKPKNETLVRMQAETQYREMPGAELRMLDGDDRTVELSFSSEEPIERWFGNEVLVHEAGNIRLDRINNGGPVLINHQRNLLAGGLEKGSAHIDEDKKLRGNIRLSRTQIGEDALINIADGILVNVSVGYQIHGAREEIVDGESTYYIDDWEPIEISLVSVPADTTVGVGRSLPTPEEANTMADEQTPTRTQPAPVPEQQAPVDMKVIENQVREKELKRLNEIEAIGATHGLVELAREHIQKGTSVEDFHKLALDALKDKPADPVRTSEDLDLGMSDREVDSYSMTRAISAMMDRKWSENGGLEREASLAMEQKLGKSARGFFLPEDVKRSWAPAGRIHLPEAALRHLAPAQRDLVVGTATAGGHLVDTQLLAASFIDLLHNSMVVRSLGATVISGLVGNIAIPRQTAGATAYWLPESGAPSGSQAAIDQVAMSPKTVGAFTDFSRRLMLQSSISVEAFVRMDLARTIALAIDLAALVGSGASNQPTGILNTSGIGSVLYPNGGSPTWPSTVQMETEVATDNALVGTLAYIFTALLRGSMKTTAKDAGSGLFIWGDSGMVNGYRAEVTNQLPAGYGLFGNWSDLVIGEWSGTDILVDPYTGSTAGTVRVVAHHDCDIAVRHPESFSETHETP